MSYKDPAVRRAYHKAYSAKWFASRPGYRRKTTWKIRGIDENQAELLYDKTRACQICGKLVDGAAKQVDHDHKTMKVRGILCKNCNLALGLLHEDKRTIERAMKYLAETDRGV